MLEVYGHFWWWCQLLVSSNSTWWWHSICQRLLVLWCSSCVVFPKRYVRGMLLGTQFRCVLVRVVLCRHHLKHLCTQCISCLGLDSVGWVPEPCLLSNGEKQHDVPVSSQISLAVWWAELVVLLFWPIPFWISCNILLIQGKLWPV